MKKYILSLSLLAISLLQANAQSMAIGPEVGIGFSTMTTKYNGVKNVGEYLTGLKAGGIFDIGLGKTISLQPGIMFHMKGYKNDYTNTVVLNNLTYRETVSSTVRTNYLEIPLNLQFNFHAGPGDFFVGVGPYAGFALSGNIESETSKTLANATEATTTTTEQTRALEIGDHPTMDDIASSDVGLNVNTGYRWHSGWLVRGNAGFGLMNIKPGGTSNNSLRHFSLALTVGYLFGM